MASLFEQELEKALIEIGPDPSLKQDMASTKLADAFVGTVDKAIDLEVEETLWSGDALENSLNLFLNPDMTAEEKEAKWEQVQSRFNLTRETKGKRKLEKGAKQLTETAGAGGFTRPEDLWLSEDQQGRLYDQTPAQKMQELASKRALSDADVRTWALSEQTEEDIKKLSPDAQEKLAGMREVRPVTELTEGEGGSWSSLWRGPLSLLTSGMEGMSTALGETFRHIAAETGRQPLNISDIEAAEKLSTNKDIENLDLDDIHRNIGSQNGRFGGVGIVDMVGHMVKNPGDTIENAFRGGAGFFKGAGETLGEGFGASFGVALPDQDKLAYALQEGADFYRKQAQAYVENKYPQASAGEKKGRAYRLTKVLMARDSAFLLSDDPEAMEALITGVLDPLNVIPISKVVKPITAPARALAKTKVGAAALKKTVDTMYKTPLIGNAIKGAQSMFVYQDSILRETNEALRAGKITAEEAQERFLKAGKIGDDIGVAVNDINERMAGIHELIELGSLGWKSEKLKTKFFRLMEDPKAYAYARLVNNRGAPEEMLLKAKDGLHKRVKQYFPDATTKETDELTRRIGLYKPRADDIANKAEELRVLLKTIVKEESDEALKMVVPAGRIGNGKLFLPHAKNTSGEYLDEFMDNFGFSRGGKHKSAMTRTNSTHKGVVEDAEIQWGAYGGALKKLAASVVTIKSLNEIAIRGKNFVHLRKVDFEPNKKAVKELDRKPLGASKTFDKQTKWDTIRDTAEEMHNVTGVKWMRLPEGELTDLFVKATQGPGARYSADDVLMVPSAMGNTMKTAYNLVEKELTGSSKHFFGFIKELNDYLYQPMVASFRQGATVLGTLQFHATQAIGGVGYGFVANGLRGFDPKKMALSGYMASRAAGAPKWMGKAGKVPEQAFKKAYLGLTDDVGSITLAKGEVLDMQDAIAAFERAGLHRQAELRYALDLGPGKGPLAAVPRFMRKTSQKLGAEQAAIFTDNYQRFLTFISALEDTSELGIAKALDYTHKYIGLHTRLTPFERTVGRNLFGFYTWNRFALPHFFRAVYHNTGRMAVFEKARRFWGAHLGADIPVTNQGLNSWQKGVGAFPSQEQDQPDFFMKGSHDLAVSIMESPLSTVGAYYSLLTGEANPAVQQLVPMAYAMIQTIGGYDPFTGQETPGMWLNPMAYLLESDDVDAGMVEFLNESRKYPLSHTVLSPIARPSKAMLALTHYLHKNGRVEDAVDMHMAFIANRSWLGLERGLIGASRVFQGKPFTPGQGWVGTLGGLERQYETGLPEENVIRRIRSRGK